MGFEGASGFHPAGGGGGDVTQEELDAEIAARIAADLVLQADIDQEVADREAADLILQGNIDIESARITNIENNELKVLYYESINTAAGSITIPANATIILNDFPEGLDAVVETIVNGTPSGLSPSTAGGVPVTVTSFDAAGNYVLSGVPSGYPVALLFVLKIQELYYSNLNFDNIIEAQNIDAATIAYVDAELALKEDLTNKVTTFTGNEASTTKYPVVKAIIDYFTQGQLFTILGAAGAAVSGYLTSADWNTFNNKQPAGSYATLTGAETLTNKNIQKRVVAIPQSATPATNIDLVDIASITALAQAITSMTSGLTGTPFDGQMIMWQITDNGTARAIAWGLSFASTTGATLPTTTVISTMLRVLTQYNSVTLKHECIATG